MNKTQLPKKRILFSYILSLLLLTLLMGLYTSDTMSNIPYALLFVIAVGFALSFAYCAYLILIILIKNTPNKSEERLDETFKTIKRNHYEIFKLSNRFNDLFKTNDENKEEQDKLIENSNKSKATAIEKLNKQLSDQNIMNEELKLEIEKLTKQKDQDNILQLMYNNMGEIIEYFRISKSHAKLSFWLALVSCIIGIILFSFAVIYAVVSNNLTPAIIAASAGAISELFAATSLVVHKKSLEQLNHYYNALHENEMFLSTVYLVGNISYEKRDDIYVEIIRNEMKLRLSKTFPKNKNI